MSICKISKWKIQKCSTQVAPAGEKVFQGGDFLKDAIEKENWGKWKVRCSRMGGLTVCLRSGKRGR